MPFSFIGAEDHDFQRIGNVSIDTATTAARRQVNARCSLKVVSAGVGDAAGWQAQFSGAVASLWMTARLYNLSSTLHADNDMIAFLDGTVRRVCISLDATLKVKIRKRDAAGTYTTLATSTNSFAASLLQKIDVQIIYGVAGTINVYVDNLLYVTYSGDVTTNSATTLSGFVLGNINTGGSHWSESFISSSDTRSMSLVTLPCAANGNAFNWTGTFASVDEVISDDTDMSVSTTAGQVMETTVSTAGLTGNPAVHAVCVSGRGMKGGTGPQSVAMAVRTAGNDFYSSNISLPFSFDRIASVFEVNPSSAGAWSSTDLANSGFNIGAKSVT